MAPSRKQREEELRGIIEAQARITEALERLHLEDTNRIPTLGEKIADVVVGFIGSWRFLMLQTFLMLTWVFINAIGFFAFDKFPFILLNLILSSQAAFSFPLVLMAQNRMEKKDRQRAVDSYRTVLHLEELLKDLHSKIEKKEKNGKS